MDLSHLSDEEFLAVVAAHREWLVVLLRQLGQHRSMSAALQAEAARRAQRAAEVPALVAAQLAKLGAQGG